MSWSWAQTLRHQMPPKIQDLWAQQLARLGSAGGRPHDLISLFFLATISAHIGRKRLPDVHTMCKPCPLGRPSAGLCRLALGLHAAWVASHLPTKSPL